MAPQKKTNNELHPVLVARWRLAGGRLPLLGRHMKALAARRINGSALTPELLGWAKQHIEWTLNPSSVEEKNGVLILVVTKDGKAYMSTGPYHPLQKETASSTMQQIINERAKTAQEEAEKTGVAPELLWAVEDTAAAKQPSLLVGSNSAKPLSGVNSLLYDLAKTKGYRLTFVPNLANSLPEKQHSYFLVSDEHGIVPAESTPASIIQELQENYQKLLDSVAM